LFQEVLRAERMVHETSIYAPLYLATKKGKNSTSEEFCLTPLLESQAKRSQETKKVIAREVNYFQEHRDHLHYRVAGRWNHWENNSSDDGAVADSLGADRD
jgi:hypothetical protein